MLDVAKIDTEVAELLDQLGRLSFGDCVIAGVKEDAGTASVTGSFSRIP
ncbi:hypothetical protein GGC47_004569 [Bosea sp. OAE752]